MDEGKSSRTEYPLISAALFAALQDLLVGSPDGKTLCYRDGDQIYTIVVRALDGLPVKASAPVPSYDPGGDHILAMPSPYTLDGEKLAELIWPHIEQRLTDELGRVQQAGQIQSVDGLRPPPESSDLLRLLVTKGPLYAKDAAELLHTNNSYVRKLYSQLKMDGWAKVDERGRWCVTEDGHERLRGSAPTLSSQES